MVRIRCWMLSWFGLRKITTKLIIKEITTLALITLPPNCSYCQHTMLLVLFKILVALVLTWDGRGVIVDPHKIRSTYLGCFDYIYDRKVQIDCHLWPWRMFAIIWDILLIKMSLFLHKVEVKLCKHHPPRTPLVGSHWVVIVSYDIRNLILLVLVNSFD